MTDLNTSTRSSEFLQERVAYLEESNQRFISILEMLASSSEFQGNLSNAKDTGSIFEATASQLQRLFSFNSLGFLESQPDGSFELIMALPVQSHTVLESMVESRMMDGTFAWALNRNQAVLVPSETTETLVLQVISTQSCVRGMFVATLTGSSIALDAASLNALSIVLYTCAYALESTILYAMLHDHTQNLEERVQMRTKDLEEARKQAEAANLAKSDFLANMSHEIRTPMNGVMGMTDLILKGGITPQKEQLYLRAIKDSADSLMLIINDILDFSKIEAGKFTLENNPFSPKQVLEASLSVLYIKAEEKGLKVYSSISPIVPVCLYGDQGRLRQVITNLVGNAIKFCQQGHISIDFTLHSRESDAITILVRVKDTGIGISPEACKRIFNQFEQADSSTTRKFGGTGLGLAICKKLVELMGGKIWVESTIGEGSCFIFTARFTIGDERLLLSEESPTNTSNSTQFQQISILLADDVEINRALVQAVLEPYGHKITVAQNGLEALEAFKNDTFDLVLMDVQMPKMDGLQAARAIRTYEQKKGLTSETPIIAMTAFAGSEDRQICLDAGMNDYLTKPVKPENLLLLVHSFTKRARNRNGGDETVNCPNSKPDTSEETLEEPQVTELIFNKDELLDRIGGKEDMIPRFIGFFYKGTRPQLQELENAVSEKDVQRILRSAHAIKGAAGNISALKMYHTATRMEHAAKCGNISETQLLIEKLMSEYREFTDTVNSMGFAIETA